MVLSITLHVVGVGIINNMQKATKKRCLACEGSSVCHFDMSKRPPLNSGRPAASVPEAADPELDAVAC